MARLKPYLQLVRLPNVFTAGADSLAGWLLVQGTFREPARWVPLVLASMCVYAAGIALNDVFDVELDRAERPGRPLPSGAVSKRFAIGLAVGLLGLGLGLAASSGSLASLGVAALLVASVLAYDAGLRKTPLGQIAMGTCRGLDVLLGMSQATKMGGPLAWTVAASIGLFVAGLTWISRAETHTGRAGPVAFGLVVQDLALAALVACALGGARFPAASAERTLIPAEGLAVLGLTALFVNLAAGRAVTDPNPATIQRAVKTGVLSLVWLHVGMVAAVRGPGPALAVAMLWPPAFVLARWLYAT
jgi:4-hydroxybenzoate polyprenyltransferase